MEEKYLEYESGDNKIPYLPQVNLEELVNEKGNAKENKILEKIFTDRAKILKATVRELLKELTLREELYRKIMDEIENDICKTETYLHEIKEKVERSYEADKLQFGRRRTQLEARIIKLEQEKRQEKREFWRDMAWLKKYLLSAFADYWDLVNKRKFLFYG